MKCWKRRAVHLVDDGTAIYFYRDTLRTWRLFIIHRENRLLNMVKSTQCSAQNTLLSSISKECLGNSTRTSIQIRPLTEKRGTTGQDEPSPLLSRNRLKKKTAIYPPVLDKQDLDFSGGKFITEFARALIHPANKVLPAVSVAFLNRILVVHSSHRVSQHSAKRRSLWFHRSPIYQC